MKEAEDELRELVRQWLEKAELDFETGRRMATEGERFCSIVAFHSQQAVEKLS